MTFFEEPKHHDAAGRLLDAVLTAERLDSRGAVRPVLGPKARAAAVAVVAEALAAVERHGALTKLRPSEPRSTARALRVLADAAAKVEVLLPHTAVAQAAKPAREAAEVRLRRVGRAPAHRPRADWRADAGAALRALGLAPAVVAVVLTAVSREK